MIATFAMEIVAMREQPIMPEQCEIRPAEISDLEDLLPLVQAYRVFYKQQPDAAREREFIEQHLRNRRSALYIARVGNGAAGFMQLFQKFSTVHLAVEWILEDLVVAPQFRKMGIAAALLARAVQHAKESNACGMYLETASDNVTAQSVYERAGWQREARFLKYNAPLA